MLNFCLDDGTPLVVAAHRFDQAAETLRMVTPESIRDPRRSKLAPSIIPLSPKIDPVFVTPLGEATDQAESFEYQNQKLPVAIAELYREADQFPEREVSVRAHIIFFDVEGEQVHRINDAHWWKAQRHHTSFEVGDTRKLVVALLHNGIVIPYQGKWLPIEATFETDEKFFKMESDGLSGNEFRVDIQLIGKSSSGLPVLNSEISYELISSPPSFRLRT
jgi:hypothetical protein